jgi:hypothetical protein
MAPKRKRRDNRPWYDRKRRKPFVCKGPENFDFLRLPIELRHEVYKRLIPERLTGSRSLLNRNRHVTWSESGSTSVSLPVFLHRELPTLVRCRNTGKDTLVLPGKNIWDYVEIDSGASLLLARDGLLTIPFNLAKVSRLMRDDVLSFLLGGLHLRFEHIGIACWYASVRPLLPSNLISLEIDTPIEDGKHLRQRWLAKLCAHFPRLEYLKISGIHTHKSASLFGTRYKIDDLLLLKFVLDNSNLERVVMVREEGNGCTQRRISGGGCTPDIAFVTKKGFQKRCQETAEQSFSEIFVEEEIAKSRASKHAINMKRSAQL